MKPIEKNVKFHETLATVKSERPIPGKTVRTNPVKEKSMKIKLSDVEINSARQPRVKINPDYVTELKDLLESGGTLPEIEVYSPNGKAPFYLADGAHRFEANLSLAFLEIGAKVFEGNSQDAFKHSLKANTSHGLRLTNADKRHKVEQALRDEELQHWSDRQIAEQCCVSTTLINSVRDELNFNSVNFEKTGKDGKSRKSAGHSRGGRKPGSGASKAATGKESGSESKPEANHKSDILDSNGVVVPPEIHSAWQDAQSTITDLQIHIHTLLDQWPSKLFGEMSQRTRESLNSLLKSLDVIVCPACKGAKCKDCSKRGLVSKRPLLETVK